MTDMIIEIVMFASLVILSFYLYEARKEINRLKGLNDKLITDNSKYTLDIKRLNMKLKEKDSYH